MGSHCAAIDAITAWLKNTNASVTAGRIGAENWRQWNRFWGICGDM